MAKPRERINARKLRKQGKSIKWIAKQLLVSPGSVSWWCRDVKLTSEQISLLEKNGRDPFYGRRLGYALKQQKLRTNKIERLRVEGIKDVGILLRRELFLVGIALYWAEGFKKDSQVGLGSSDPAMILMFIRWLKECFGYTTEDLLIRVTVNEAHEYRIGEIIKYWSNLLGIDEELFQKPFYQHVKWKKEYDNPENYFGVLRVRVRRSKDFLRKIYGFIEGLKKNV